MNTASFQMLASCIGAAGFWAVWFYFIKEYRVSAFRERLFSIREELFNLAADGQVSFDEPAYIELRALINGMLRFAHRVTFLTLITSARNPSLADGDPNSYQMWRDALDRLPPETKQQLEMVHSRVFSEFMSQLVSGSIVLLPLSLLLRIAFSLRTLLARYFSSKQIEEISSRTAMEKGLAQTLNAQSLVEVAYREGKASDKLELSLA